MRKAALHNLGCKVNAYETEAMQELLEKSGYQIVPFDEEADVYIINTCSVTNTADRKSRQMLSRARKQSPESVIVAAGCYVQAQADAGKRDENIDIIIGNNKKKELIPILDAYFADKEKKKRSEVIDINHTREYEPLSLTRTAEHTRAYLKVQDGCNQFCTYCIIPYTRGRARSRELADVMQEVRALAANGYQEVVLTGIHLSSYGLDGPEQGKGSLLSLIRSVHEVEGIRRIRLGSLEPRIITAEFAHSLAEMPKVCPHFHLSLQSGCDATLRRMNRRYSSEEYKEKCSILRKYFTEPALTTDIIVGFPGETKEEFETSKRFVDKIHFYETHIFKYSRRQGTRAAVMEGQVSETEKARRSRLMIEMGKRKQTAYEEKWIGKKVDVLFEELVEENGEWTAEGHTREYLRIAVPCCKGEEHLWLNQIKEIEIGKKSQIIH